MKLVLIFILAQLHVGNNPVPKKLEGEWACPVGWVAYWPEINIIVDDPKTNHIANVMCTKDDGSWCKLHQSCTWASGGHGKPAKYLPAKKKEK